MEKTQQKMSGKRYLFIILVPFIVVGSMISNSYGEELPRTRYGVSIFGGTGDAWHNETDFAVYGVLPRVSFPLHRNWDLDVEGNYSYWNIRRSNNLYFLGVNANILFKPFQRKWGSLFFLGGVGLGYDSAGKRVKEIGDSHCGGILQGGVGAYYDLGKGMAFRVEYRFYHLSEPFRNDTGLNSHNVLLGISF